MTVDLTEKAVTLIQDETLPPEAGEIICEESKSFEKIMNSIIANHKKYAPLYFISVWTQKDPFMINIVKRKYIVRKTCPEPQWNSEVYCYSNRSDQLLLEWVLPTEQDALSILKNKEIYDPRLITYIQKFMSNTLKIPSYSP